MRIAPLDGPNALDIYLRYEALEQDLIENDLEFLWAPFEGLRAKSGHRPARGSSAAELFAAYPQVGNLIARHCSAEISKFGYVQPT